MDPRSILTPQFCATAAGILHIPKKIIITVDNGTGLSRKNVWAYSRTKCRMPIKHCRHFIFKYLLCLPLISAFCPQLRSCVLFCSKNLLFLSDSSSGAISDCSIVNWNNIWSLALGPTSLLFNEYRMLLP